jgi:DNA-binding transcriptional regulator WhiA
LLGKHYCSKECYYAKRVSNKQLLAVKSGEFVEAKNLSRTDFTSVPVLRDTVDPGLTLGQARLLGLFAAEGYYKLYAYQGNEKVAPTWAFHRDETASLAKSVVALLKSEFGVEAKIHPHSNDNGIHVDTAVNRDLVQFFSHWVPGESKTKRLHSDLLRAPVEVQRELLQGWFEGDGSFTTSKTDFRLTGSTASRSMANQMQMMLHRLGVSSHLTRSETDGRSRVRSEDGSVRIESDPSKRCVSWQVACGGGWLENLVEGTYYEPGYRASLEANGGVQRVPELRFLNGYHLQMVEKIDRFSYSGPVYNLEVAGDNSYLANGVSVHNCDSFERKLLLSSFKTFIGAQSYVEHVQIPELSKGRIIDAAARDVGDSVYIDILIANDLKHAPLIRAIKSGKLGTLSMGCTTSSTICTKCGNVAEDETHLCPCVRYFKGSEFIDGLGIKRKVAELCFVSGSRVVMSDGSRRGVETLQVGDMVVTHKGVPREVTRVFERSYRGPLIAVKAEGVPQTLQVTPEHPFWVLSVRDECACGCGGKLPRPKDFGKARFWRRYLKGHNPNQVVSLSPPEFVFKKAEDLRPGDVLGMPILTEQRVSVSDVDEDRAELLGWFLAEGSFIKHKGQRRGVQFTLNGEDENEVVHRLAGLLEKCFTPEQRLTSPPKRRSHGRGNATDSLLNALKTPKLTCDLKQIFPSSYVGAILRRYARKGIVSSRPLEPGERLDVKGRRRSRARVWCSLQDEALSERTTNYEANSGRKHLAKLTQYNARARCEPRVHLYKRTEGGLKLVVAYNNTSAADWFYRHAGEYSDSKRLSEEALYWPVRLQRQILKAYVHGDGSVDRVARHYGSSVSETLVSQMQLVSARCGFWTRRQVVYEGRSVEIAQVVNGDACVGIDGLKPRHELHFQPSDETTQFFGFDVDHERGTGPRWRSFRGYMLYSIRGLSRRTYDGKVYNLAVDQDESYLVEGLASHNCGHYTDPNSVRFIEASWVANPAFKGAVLRNIITHGVPEGVERQLHKAFLMPTPVVDPSHMSRAARWTLGQEEDFTDTFEPETESSPEVEEDPVDKAVSDLTDAIREKAIRKVRDEISKSEVDEIRTHDPNTQNDTLIRSALQHPEWRKIARSVFSFVGKQRTKRVLQGLILHKQGGWKRVQAAGFTGREILAVSRVMDLMGQKTTMAGENRVYRVVLDVGGSAPYEDEKTYLAACRQVLGRPVTGSEAARLLEKGRLYALGRS